MEPYRPDMQKDEKNVTMAERQEAKRRIEGSLAPDLEGESSENHVLPPEMRGEMMGANFQ